MVVFTFQIQKVLSKLELLKLILILTLKWTAHFYLRAFSGNVLDVLFVVKALVWVLLVANLALAECERGQLVAIPPCDVGFYKFELAHRAQKHILTLGVWVEREETCFVLNFELTLCFFDATFAKYLLTPTAHADRKSDKS